MSRDGENTLEFYEGVDLAIRADHADRALLA